MGERWNPPIEPMEDTYEAPARPTTIEDYGPVDVPWNRADRRSPERPERRDGDPADAPGGIDAPFGDAGTDREGP